MFLAMDGALAGIAAVSAPVKPTTADALAALRSTASMVGKALRLRGAAIH